MSDLIYDNIKAGKYDNKVPYVRHSKDKEAWQAYRDGERAAINLFKQDLEEDYGTNNHPLADSLWRKAWEDGHSSGLHEVVGHYNDLVEYFVVPFNKHLRELGLMK